MTRQMAGSACRIAGILALIVGAVILYPLMDGLRFQRGSSVVLGAVPWVIIGAVLIIAGTLIIKKKTDGQNR